MHLHGSDIDALRRLAEVAPDLAETIIKQKDTLNRRDHASYRFGVTAAVILAIGLLISLSFVLVEIGIILSLVLVAALMASALIIRVIITGEWSDTSVIGQIISGITKTLGGKPKD